MKINKKQYKAIGHIIDRLVYDGKDEGANWRAEIEDEDTGRSATLIVKIDTYKETYFVDYKGEVTTWRKVKV